MSKKMISLLFLFVSLFAHAGNEVGNGGIVLYSLTTKVPSVLLDAYETEARYGFTIKWPKEMRDDLSIAMEFTKRLAAYDPRLQNQLNTWIKTFYAEASIASSLPLIFDTGVGIHIPKGYGFGQLVIQTKHDNQTHYLLNERFWEMLPVEQRAIAILHEVVYRKALEVNPNLFSSLKVRQFVVLLISNEISYFSDYGYQSALEHLDLK